MILFCFFSAIQQRTPQANTTAAGTVAAGQRLRAPTTPTAAASCPYYSCPHHARPGRLVLPRVCCSRTRCCALRFVDDDGRASSVFRLMILCCFLLAISALQQRHRKLFCFLKQFQQYSCGHRRCWTAASCPYNSDSSGLLPLLLLPTPRQAGKACSASCVLFSYSLLCASFRGR